MSEAKTNDDNLVDGIIGDADSMCIVVRLSVSLIVPVIPYHHSTEYHILCHCWNFYHRVI
jgi:hypothetical protein